MQALSSALMAPSATPITGVSRTVVCNTLNMVKSLHLAELQDLPFVSKEPRTGLFTLAEFVRAARQRDARLQTTPAPLCLRQLWKEELGLPHLQARTRARWKHRQEKVGDSPHATGRDGTLWRTLPPGANRFPG